MVATVGYVDAAALIVVVVAAVAVAVAAVAATMGGANGQGLQRGLSEVSTAWGTQGTQRI